MLLCQYMETGNRNSGLKKCNTISCRLEYFTCISLTDFVFSVFSPSQFLIEVKNSMSSIVPSDWVKISRWVASFGATLHLYSPLNVNVSVIKLYFISFFPVHV